MNFWMGFGVCVKYKSSLYLKILPMLMKYRILLMRNTVEMAGGDIYVQKLALYLNIMQFSKFEK